MRARLRLSFAEFFVCLGVALFVASLCMLARGWRLSTPLSVPTGTLASARALGLGLLGGVGAAGLGLVAMRRRVELRLSGATGDVRRSRQGAASIRLRGKVRASFLGGPDAPNGLDGASNRGAPVASAQDGSDLAMSTSPLKRGVPRVEHEGAWHTLH